MSFSNMASKHFSFEPESHFFFLTPEANGIQFSKGLVWFNKMSLQNSLNQSWHRQSSISKYLVRPTLIGGQACEFSRILGALNLCCFNEWNWEDALTHNHIFVFVPEYCSTDVLKCYFMSFANPLSHKQNRVARQKQQI